MAQPLKAIVTGTFFILSSGFAQPNASRSKQMYGDAIAETKPSIASIKVAYTDRTASFGTGVFVNQDGFFLTANHVISAESKTLKRITILIPLPSVEIAGGGVSRGNVIGLNAKLIAVDAGNDLAVLLADKNPFGSDWATANFPGLGKAMPITFTHFDTRPLDDGEELLITGFPPEDFTLRTAYARIVKIKSVEPLHDDRSSRYLADVQGDQAISGAPVFSTRTRSMIGFCKVAYPANVPTTKQSQASGIRSPMNGFGKDLGTRRTKITTIMPSTYLMKFMRENGVAFVILPGQF